MKRTWYILLLVAALLLSLSFATVSLADAGFFSDDSDWGGSSDWGSDSDWGDSDYSGGGGSWNFSGLGFFIILIIYFMVRNKKAKKAGGQVAPPVPARSASLNELKAADPNFSEQRILDMVGNLYVQMQNSWQQKQWEPMRMWMTDQLYTQMGRQLEELKRRNQTNYVERIAVMESAITNYVREGEMDALTVRLTARVTDYTLDDATGNLVNGSKTASKYLTYDWKLIRRAGRLTVVEEDDRVVRKSCPACGAPMDVSFSGKCEYCGSVITLTDYDWVLSSITGISQRTQ